MSHILIVEDEPKIARFVSLELEHEGYETTIESDGRVALNLALENDYDLIVLDVMLPSLNGIEILRRLRQSKDTPVIILTARDQIVDKVAGLDIGANDYMTKPFVIEELLARIRANIRKRKVQVIEHGKLKVDLERNSVTYGGDLIDVTKKEYDLLVYLLQNKNRVLSRQQIMDAVWGYNYSTSTNSVDVYVRHLRSLIDDKYKVQIIETVRGFGYIIR